MEDTSRWDRAVASVAPFLPDQEADGWSFLVDEGLVREDRRARTKFRELVMANRPPGGGVLHIGASMAWRVARGLRDAGLLTAAADARDPHGAIAAERAARWRARRRPLPPRPASLSEVVEEAAIGGFTLGRRLGSFDEHEVHAARQADGTDVVLVIHPGDHPDLHTVTSFLHAAEDARAIVHPNVAAVLAVEKHGDLFVAAFEAAELTLEEAIRRSRLYDPYPQAQARVLRHAAEVADALSAAAARGILHDDVRPIHVLLVDGVARLAFGLARGVAALAARAAGGVSSRSDYLAPERALTTAALVWSWAVLVMDMFAGETGRSPRGGALAGLEAHVAAGRRNGMPAMPGDVLALLRRCFDAEPDRRPSLHDLGVLVRGGAAG